MSRKPKLFKKNSFGSIQKKESDIDLEKAFVYMLSIPLTVLAEDYWKKSIDKKGPDFIDKCMDLYEDVQNGKKSIKSLVNTLYEKGHVKIDAGWIRNSK